MVSPFHKLKNAKSAAGAVMDHPATEVVEFEEELGHAELVFRWSPDASVQALKGLDHTLTAAGWEEQTEDSTIGDAIRYEWDKMRLSEGDNPGKERRDRVREVREALGFGDTSNRPDGRLAYDELTTAARELGGEEGDNDG